jgi:hypothetical protein
MKRVLICLLVAACLVAVTVIAQAAVKRGTYRGKTGADDPVSFKVTRAKKVTQFSYDRIHLTCTDGDSFDSTRAIPPGQKVNVTRRGRFEFEAGNADRSFRFQVAGRIRSPRASGTIQVFATFDENNQLDPNGSVRCDSGELKWNVRRR